MRTVQGEFEVISSSKSHLIHFSLKNLQTIMELQVGGINDNHVGDVGEGQMVKGRHVEQLSCVPDNGVRA